MLGVRQIVQLEFLLLIVSYSITLSTASGQVLAELMLDGMTKLDGVEPLDPQV